MQAEFEVSQQSFSDGFESGFLNNWDGGDATFDGTHVHSGGYALSAAAGHSAYKDIGTTLNDFYLRFYINFGTAITTGVGAQLSFTWDSSWGNSACLYIQNDGSGPYWGLENISSSPMTINVGQWYCVEIERKAGTDDGILKIWVDGTNVASSTTETIVAAQVFNIGNGASSSFQVYYDDVVI